MRFFLFLIISFSVVFQANSNELKPRIKTVVLKPFTVFTLPIVPDLGTRFVFPFVLDEDAGEIPFTLNITNKVFETTRENGRNSFVVKVRDSVEGGQQAKYLGQMFINVAGYNVTVTLSTTYNLKKQYSDVVFKLSKKKREDLIRQVVNKRVAAMEASIQAKEKVIDQKIEGQALLMIGKLLLKGSKNEGIKEESSITNKSGEKIKLYLNESNSYGAFHVFLYEVTNLTSKTLNIKDTLLFTESKGGRKQKIISANNIKSRIGSDETAKGMIVTNNPLALSADHLRLSVLSSEGEMSVLW